MELSPEEKINKAVWWVLQEIKAESLVVSKDEYIYFEPTYRDTLNISESDQIRALNLLKKEGVIEFKDKKFLFGMREMQANLYGAKPVGYYLNILPKFEKTYKKHQEKQTRNALDIYAPYVLKGDMDPQMLKDEMTSITRAERKKNENRYTEILDTGQEKEKKNLENYLITRDPGTGDFYYKKKLIEFKNKEAIYYLIFECLFCEGDIEGFCSYEKINNYLIRQGKEKCFGKEKTRKRIRNGIENLKRFSNLPEKAPDKKNIIQKIKGKGLILYNPHL